MATLKFFQATKSAATSKMRRLVGNANYGTIGFCNIQLKKRYADDYCEYNNIDPQFVIELSSNYHSESTMENMYRTNGKKW